ncbi:unnamed protein product [Calicophoron daubneyi]|uniref:Uncharacterized protein n=1 Tax=Calicophoron daubneyi TaxID=300641 RepID=A0AAV2TYM7_CALDB
MDKSNLKEVSDIGNKLNTKASSTSFTSAFGTQLRLNVSCTQTPSQPRAATTDEFMGDRTESYSLSARIKQDSPASQMEHRKPNQKIQKLQENSVASWGPNTSTRGFSLPPPCEGGKLVWKNTSPSAIQPDSDAQSTEISMAINVTLTFGQNDDFPETSECESEALLNINELTYSCETVNGTKENNAKEIGDKKDVHRVSKATARGHTLSPAVVSTSGPNTLAENAFLPKQSVRQTVITVDMEFEKNGPLTNEWPEPIFLSCSFEIEVGFQVADSNATKYHVAFTTKVILSYPKFSSDQERTTDEDRSKRGPLCCNRSPKRVSDRKDATYPRLNFAGIVLTDVQPVPNQMKQADLIKDVPSPKEAGPQEKLIEQEKNVPQTWHESRSPKSTTPTNVLKCLKCFGGREPDASEIKTYPVEPTVPNSGRFLKLKGKIIHTQNGIECPTTADMLCYYYPDMCDSTAASLDTKSVLAEQRRKEWIERAYVIQRAAACPTVVPDPNPRRSSTASEILEKFRRSLRQSQQNLKNAYKKRSASSDPNIESNVGEIGTGKSKQSKIRSICRRKSDNKVKTSAEDDNYHRSRSLSLGHIPQHYQNLIFSWGSSITAHVLPKQSRFSMSTSGTGQFSSVSSRQPTPADRSLPADKRMVENKPNSSPEPYIREKQQINKTKGSVSADVSPSLGIPHSKQQPCNVSGYSSPTQSWKNQQLDLPGANSTVFLGSSIGMGWTTPGEKSRIDLGQYVMLKTDGNQAFCPSSEPSREIPSPVCDDQVPEVAEQEIAPKVCDDSVVMSTGKWGVANVPRDTEQNKHLDADDGFGPRRHRIQTIWPGCESLLKEKMGTYTGNIAPNTVVTGTGKNDYNSETDSASSGSANDVDTGANEALVSTVLPDESFKLKGDDSKHEGLYRNQPKSISVHMCVDSKSEAIDSTVLQTETAFFVQFRVYPSVTNMACTLKCGLRIDRGEPVYVNETRKTERTEKAKKFAVPVVPVLPKPPHSEGENYESNLATVPTVAHSNVESTGVESSTTPRVIADIQSSSGHTRQSTDQNLSPNISEQNSGRMKWLTNEVWLTIQIEESSLRKIDAAYIQVMSTFLPPNKSTPMTLIAVELCNNAGNPNEIVSCDFLISSGGGKDGSQKREYYAICDLIVEEVWVYGPPFEGYAGFEGGILGQGYTKSSPHYPGAMTDQLCAALTSSSGNALGASENQKPTTALLCKERVPSWGAIVQKDNVLEDKSKGAESGSVDTIILSNISITPTYESSGHGRVRRRSKRFTLNRDPVTTPSNPIRSQLQTNVSRNPKLDSENHVSANDSHASTETDIPLTGGNSMTQVINFRSMNVSYIDTAEKIKPRRDNNLDAQLKRMKLSPNRINDVITGPSKRWGQTEMSRSFIKSRKRRIHPSASPCRGYGSSIGTNTVLEGSPYMQWSHITAALVPASGFCLRNLNKVVSLRQPTPTFGGVNIIQCSSGISSDGNRCIASRNFTTQRATATQTDGRTFYAHVPCERYDSISANTDGTFEIFTCDKDNALLWNMMMCSSKVNKKNASLSKNKVNGYENVDSTLSFQDYSVHSLEIHYPSHPISLTEKSTDRNALRYAPSLSKIPSPSVGEASTKTGSVFGSFNRFVSSRYQKNSVDCTPTSGLSPTEQSTTTQSRSEETRDGEIMGRRMLLAGALKEFRGEDGQESFLHAKNTKLHGRKMTGDIGVKLSGNCNETKNNPKSFVNQYFNALENRHKKPKPIPEPELSSGFMKLAQIKRDFTRSDIRQFFRKHLDAIDSDLSGRSSNLPILPSPIGTVDYLRQFKHYHVPSEMRADVQKTSQIFDHRSQCHEELRANVNTADVNTPTSSQIASPTERSDDLRTPEDEFAREDCLTPTSCSQRETANLQKIQPSYDTHTLRLNSIPPNGVTPQTVTRSNAFQSTGPPGSVCTIHALPAQCINLYDFQQNVIDFPHPNQTGHPTVCACCTCLCQSDRRLEEKPVLPTSYIVLSPAIPSLQNPGLLKHSDEHSKIMRVHPRRYSRNSRKRQTGSFDNCAQHSTPSRSRITTMTVPHPRPTRSSSGFSSFTSNSRHQERQPLRDSFRSSNPVSGNRQSRIDSQQRSSGTSASQLSSRCLSHKTLPHRKGCPRAVCLQCGHMLYCSCQKKDNVCRHEK